MSKKITIRIAVPADFANQYATGTVAILQLGEGRHKCFIHDGKLSDYRSGYAIALQGIQAIKIERMARISSYSRTTDRQAAQIVLDRIVARVGLEKVREQLAKFPTLNS